MSVPRYTEYVTRNGAADMMKTVCGEYVKHSDYYALSKQIEAGELIHWRPIAEAKKDGTYLFVWTGQKWTRASNIYEESGMDAWTDERGMEVNPTHFAEVKGPRS